MEPSSSSAGGPVYFVSPLPPPRFPNRHRWPRELPFSCTLKLFWLTDAGRFRKPCIFPLYLQSLGKAWRITAREILSETLSPGSTHPNYLYHTSSLGFPSCSSKLHVSFKQNPRMGAGCKQSLRVSAHADVRAQYTCTPLCANYLSPVCIWLGCTACSPRARPADIPAQINSRQLLGASDALVINSCVGLHTADPPTSAIPPEQAVSFQISVCQAKAGSDQRSFSAEHAGGEPGEETPVPQIPSLSRGSRRWLCPAALAATNAKNTMAYFKVFLYPQRNNKMLTAKPVLMV